jgi:hypothetical protein
MIRTAQEAPNPVLSEGDGVSTGDRSPDSFDHTTMDQRHGSVPKPLRGERVGSEFEDLNKNQPIAKLLLRSIRERSREKSAMDLSAATLHAMQDELGYIQKRAFIGAIGKGLIGLAGKTAKGGLIRRGAAKSLRLAHKAGFRGQSAYKALGAGALGAGAIGAAGTGYMLG